MQCDGERFPVNCIIYIKQRLREEDCQSQLIACVIVRSMVRAVLCG